MATQNLWNYKRNKPRKLDIAERPEAPTNPSVSPRLAAQAALIAGRSPSGQRSEAQSYMLRSLPYLGGYDLSKARTTAENPGRPAPMPIAGNTAQTPKVPTQGDRARGFAIGQAPRAAQLGVDLLSGGASVAPSTQFAAGIGGAMTGNPAAAAAQIGGATTAGGGSLAGMAGSALPWLGLAGQAYGYATQGYDSYDKLTNDTASDDSAGSIKGALLATGPVAGWAAPLVDVIGVKSGKGKDQMRRDAVRKHFRKNGFIDDDYNIKLANGGVFNVGDETQRGLNSPDNKVYNINWEDPRAHEMVGFVQPLVDLMVGNNEKMSSDTAGMLVNAAMSSGDSGIDSIRGFYEQAGFNRETAAQAINELAKDAERLPPERRDAYLAAIDALFPLAQGAKPAPTSATAASSGSSGGKPKAPTSASTPVAPPSVPLAPVASPVDYGQSIIDVYQQNAGTRPNAALNPNLISSNSAPISLNPSARRKRAI